MKPRYLLASTLLLAVLAAETPTAFAAGYELSSPGARALGRGGASYAGSDDPLALYFNPANLGRIHKYRLFGSASALFSNTCMQREFVANPAGANTYRPAAEARDTNLQTIDGRSFLPQVCNSGRPSIVPQLGVTIPVIDGLTLAVGLVVPASMQIVKYGNDGEVVNANGDTVPTPVRYLTDNQNLLQVFPTVGVGYAPIDQFRVGLSFGWGVTVADFTNYTFSTPGVDARNTLHAVDAFVPRITASVATTPVRGFDISFTYSWTADVRTDDATVNVTTPIAGIKGKVHGVGLTSPQTWNTALAFRYAQALAGGPVDDIGDRLSTERWDIELDFLVWGNKRVDNFDVDLPTGANLSGTPLPEELTIAHNWQNQYVVRLGGDFNVIPGHLALRAGFSYESDGVKDGYEQIDFTPFQRYGIHAGVTGRVGRVDLSLGYSHLFYTDIDNDGAACLGDGTEAGSRCIGRPLGAMPGPNDWVIANAGRISTGYNILSFDAMYTF